VCIALCTIVAHNIAQNRPDSFPPYPPDNHHSSDDVYLREGGIRMVAVTSEACGYALMRQLVKLTLLGSMHTVLCSKLVS